MTCFLIRACNLPPKPEKELHTSLQVRFHEIAGEDMGAKGITGDEPRVQGRQAAAKFLGRIAGFLLRN